MPTQPENSKDSTQWIAMSAALQTLQQKKDTLEQKVAAQEIILASLMTTMKEHQQLTAEQTAFQQQLKPLSDRAEAICDGAKINKLTDDTIAQVTKAAGMFSTMKTQSEHAVRKVEASHERGIRAKDYERKATTMANNAISISKQAEARANPAKARADSITPEEVENLKLIKKVPTWTSHVGTWLQRHAHAADGSAGAYGLQLQPLNTFK